MMGYKMSSSATEQSAGNTAETWLLALDPSCTFSEQQDWSHSREMPSGNKSQHSELFFSTLICYGSRGWAADMRMLLGRGGVLPHPTISIWIPYLKCKRAGIWTQTPLSQSQGSSCCTQSVVMALTHICLPKVGGATARSTRMTQWLKSRKSVLSIHMFGCWKTQTANLEVG